MAFGGNNQLKVFRPYPPQFYGCVRMHIYPTHKSHPTLIISVLLERLCETRELKSEPSKDKSDTHPVKQTQREFRPQKGVRSKQE